VSKQIWHSSNDEPQDVNVGDKIIVVVPYEQFAVDIWEATEEHGWKSPTEGSNMQVSDCLRWAWERGVIEQAIGCVR
jgi:hypothetical protein